MSPLVVSAMTFAVATAVVILAARASGVALWRRLAAACTAVALVAIAIVGLQDGSAKLAARQQVLDRTKAEMDKVSSELEAKPGSKRLAEIKRELDAIKQSLDSLK